MSHDFTQPTPEPPANEPQPLPADTVYSPDGKQWFDRTTGTWQPLAQPPAPSKKKTSGKRIALIAGLTAGVVVALTAVLPNLLKGDQRLAEASRECSAGIRGDDDRSLTLNMEGEESGSGLYTFEDVDCVLRELNVPDATYQKMIETTSNQGRLSDAWDGVEASWTYHPDDGLDVILELAD